MEKTKIIDENGHSIQTNYMLDDVIESFEKFSIENDELIKELTIQKIEYGRACVTQFLLNTEETMHKNYNYWENFDNKLKELILEIGGKPIIYQM